MRDALRRSQLAAYGVLGLPLAFVALPIYVHVPQLYSTAFGMSLATVGAVLLIARIFDAVIDPVIGALADRFAHRKLSILLAVPALICGLWGLLRPLPEAPGVAWLVSMLVLVYLGYSLATVNHHAWGAELSTDVGERTRITASREGFALIGVVLASVLPGLISSVPKEGLAQLPVVFAGLLSLAVLLAVRFTPSPTRAIAHAVDEPSGWAAPLRQARFRALLGVFAVSGIAAAIPASLVLFFVDDVLQASSHAGVFLALYFLGAALGLPVWVALARRVGRLQAWGWAMLLAVLAFVWAATLGAGQLWAFGVICVLSGSALGADLALPPSVLADVIAGDARAGAGACFGWWNFTAKLNLALAAGLSLPALEWLGCVPGSREVGGLLALSLMYAVLPAVLKLGAAYCLWRVRHRIVEV